MSRHPNPNSVSSKTGALDVNETVEFTNPYTSVAVMLSNLKRKDKHRDKIFKISVVSLAEITKTQVTRIK